MTAEEKSKVLGVIAVVTILAIYGGYEWHSTYEERKGYLEQSNKIANIEDAKSKSIAGSRKIIDTGEEQGATSEANASSSGNFNTVDIGREDTKGHINNYEIVSLSQDQLEVQKLRDLQLKEKRKKWKLSGPQRDIKFNKRYSEEFISINTLLYQLAQRYFSKQTFMDTDYSSYIDPLYIMAVSNVEFGSNTSPDVLLAPAIPTSKGVKVTKDNILTFGYSDYLDYPEVLASDRDEYRGPLQMYVTGLTEAIKPSDLLSCEWIQLQNAAPSQTKALEQANPQYVEGSGASASVDGMFLANKAGKYGDRWNYGDAMNRLAGYIHSNWVRYQNNSKAQKDGNKRIDNAYSWMAMTAIGHNASPGIYYLGDDVNIGNTYAWWPFGPYSNAREYAHYLGTDEVVAYIQNKASEAIDSYSGGGNLKFRLTRQEGFAIAEEMKDMGFIPEGLWKNNSWNNEEKVAYPIQVLYNYLLLDLIYSGK